MISKPFCCALLLVAVVWENTPTTAAQQSKIAAESKPVDKARLRPLPSNPFPTERSALLAASRNQTSIVELRWLFGGKQQIGWSVYLPLVREAIETESDAGSADFAIALARWQALNGLRQSGVMDQESWFNLIGDFQSGRISDRRVPSPDELVLAPASDFYDPDRPPELRQVEMNTYDAYRQMVAEAIKDKSLGLKTKEGQLDREEKYFKIISGFRSREYQDHLRQLSPQSGRAGLAVSSPHFTGRALDLYVGGEPVSTKDSNRMIQTRTAVYGWLVKNARRFGFQPYFYEPWHWEYVRDN